MLKVSSKLTVFFEEPFWVGVYERVVNDSLEVCKVTFGAEPKDPEIYEAFICNFNKLVFSPSVSADMHVPGKVNPKRRQRAIKKELCAQGVGTKSQQALKLQFEHSSTERKKTNRELRLLKQERQFALRQQKRKDKHRGH